jgi:hypothetical protein
LAISNKINFESYLFGQEIGVESYLSLRKSVERTMAKFQHEHGTGDLGQKTWDEEQGARGKRKGRGDKGQ